MDGSRFFLSRNTDQLHTVGQSYHGLSGDQLSFDIFGYRLRACQLETTADWLAERARQKQPTRAAFINAHCINIASGCAEYRAALKTADTLLPDGTGVALAAALAGEQAGDNLNGTDLLPALCRSAVRKGLSVFLLGAAPDVADKMAANLEKQFPGLQIAGTHHGFFSACEDMAVVEKINASGADILLIARGVPLQDIWAHQYELMINAPLIMGVGGLFDFCSGRIPRAPHWVRRLGQEWIYRLLQEPKRMAGRYLVGNMTFLAKALKFAAKRRFAKVSHSLSSDRLKRMLDVSAAGLGLALLSPLFALIAVAIKLDSAGPVFFRQTRVGQHQSRFEMVKFRSMVVDAEACKTALSASNERGDQTCFKMKKDPRITRVGAFLRRTSLDELPQLINILKGDMSLVGPRPALPQEVAKYSLRALRRLAVKPGLTCIWQISGRADIDFDQQVEMDIDYMRRQNILFDLSLLFRTIPAVLSGRGAY